jgi:hypothetical protein
MEAWPASPHHQQQEQQKEQQQQQQQQQQAPNEEGMSTQEGSEQEDFDVAGQGGAHSISAPACLGPHL